MPLTAKGKKVKNAMQKTYGAKKGKQVFYASQNKGTVTGTHKAKKSPASKRATKSSSRSRTRRY